MNRPFLQSFYRHIWIVQDRNHWEPCREIFDPRQDLLLTYDFGLKRQVESMQGEVFYIDHLADGRALEGYNRQANQFLAQWHLDENGRDLFSYRGIDFGHAFKIEIWTEVFYSVRLVLNLLTLKKLKREKLIVCAGDKFLHEALAALGLELERLPAPEGGKISYFFPIHRWMDERLHSASRGVWAVVREGLSRLVDGATSVLDRLGGRGTQRLGVFLFHYFPLAPIMALLKRDPRLRIFSENYIFTRGFLKQRRLPIGRSDKSLEEAQSFLRRYEAHRCVRWEEAGVDLAAILDKGIKRRIRRTIARHLKVLDSILLFGEQQFLKLMITFSNLGMTNALMGSYCKKKGIPVYLVINGLLIHSALDEAKEATFINGYGESIKNHYFIGRTNVVCLGDPRMDVYANKGIRKPIRRDAPTLLVGAAGFNNIDLNSYLAYEFDFLSDVLTACRTLVRDGLPLRVVVKVRSNGYIKQYKKFIGEYFPELGVECTDSVPMSKILKAADLYVSFYSQTIFEASCLGIPAIYYKIDTEQDLHPPFDGRSELITAIDVPELIENIRAFAANDPRFDAFMERSVMEKYVGPLDGEATRRNAEFIYAHFLNLSPLEGMT